MVQRYERIQVIQRVQGSTSIFNCFKNLATSLYVVRSKTGVADGSDGNLTSMACYEPELFIEEAPESMEKVYPSLLEAVEAFVAYWGE